MANTYAPIFMVAAFPLAKIGLLLMKQLSKPLANLIKNEAKKHPVMRKYVIIPTGRAYGMVENLTLRQVKGTKPSELAPLTEEETVELGANAIGEIILFGLLTVILLAEYNRQGDKKAEKERTKDEERANLVETVLDVLDEIDKLKRDVKKIQRDLEIASDVMELEEQRHTVIQDNNFLDVFQSFNRRKMRRKSEALDMSSPSP